MRPCVSICRVCVCVCKHEIVQVHLYVFWERSNPPPPLVCCPGCGSAMIALTIQQKKKHLLPDCFPCSVMEMRFSISLHRQYLNTSLLKIGLSSLLTRFLPYKCSVILQSLVEFLSMCLHKDIRLCEMWTVLLVVHSLLFKSHLVRVALMAESRISGLYYSQSSCSLHSLFHSDMLHGE